MAMYQYKNTGLVLTQGQAIAAHLADRTRNEIAYGCTVLATRQFIPGWQHKQTLEWVTAIPEDAELLEAEYGAA